MNPGCQQAEVDVLPARASSALRQRLATLPTTLLMVRQQGRLLFSWGDTTIPSGSLLTLEQVGGMPGSSGVRCPGVCDDGTSALSCGAGPAGGVCGPV